MNMQQTLGQALSDPRLAQIAGDAIRDMDLTKEPMWNQTLAELKEQNFGGNLSGGLERLFQAVDSGDWYYRLGTNGNGEITHLIWMPSDQAAADDRPYILLVPGGGFVNVWNLTEGWPIAERFNRLGYHVFILTYQVRGDHLLEREMDDMAEAVRFIRGREDHFHVKGEKYITCGFSAGGYLICLWNTEEYGFAAHSLPRPQASFPVYPLTSWKLCLKEGGFAPDSSRRLFGCDLEAAANMAYEIPEHAAAFPPTAIFLAAKDDLVPPDHSRLLADALHQHGIPCRLEIGPEGGHGFADGTGMCMAGWTDRAIAWYESLEK